MNPGNLTPILHTTMRHSRWLSFLSAMLFSSLICAEEANNQVQQPPNGSNTTKVVELGKSKTLAASSTGKSADQLSADEELQKSRIASRNAEQPSEMVSLARQYITLRAGIFKGPEVRNLAGAAPLDKNVVSLITGDFLRRIKTAPDWNESNPEWKRMAVIIEQDLTKLREELKADTHYSEIEKNIDVVIEHGLVARLNSDQLKELIQYYSSPQGKQFSNVQAKMLEELSLGEMKIQRLAASGQKIQPTQPTPDVNAFRQVLELFDETVKMQLGMLDPGPGHDRSGLQALPMMTAMGTQANYGKIDELWKSIPEQGRTAVVTWRESALAKAERNAIYESAKEIRTVFNAQNESKRMMSMLATYDQKWRSEMKH